MSRELFNVWLARVQAEMMFKEQTIFLLMDNGWAHGCSLEVQTEQYIHGIKDHSSGTTHLIDIPTTLLHFGCQTPEPGDDLLREGAVWQMVHAVAADADDSESTLHRSALSHEA